jgi:hypothetical protein
LNTEGSENEEGIAQADKKLTEELMERINNIPTVTARLTAVNGHLGALFRKHFGLQSIEAGVDAPKVYVDFFRQVNSVAHTFT